MGDCGEKELKTYQAEPSYKATAVDHGVIVPVLQSLFSGGIIGLTIGLGVGFWGGGFVSGLKAWAFSTALCAALAWFFIHYRDALWIIEKLFQHDIDGDGITGKPKPALDVPPLKVTNRINPNETVMGELPFRNRLPAVARVLSLEGADYFTKDNMTNGPHKMFSRAEFDELFKQMQDADLAEWKDEKNHKQGIRLTPAGVDLMAQLAGAAGQTIDRANTIAADNAIQVYAYDLSPTRPLWEWHDRK